jgi:hypothetical protein
MKGYAEDRVSKSPKMKNMTLRLINWTNQTFKLILCECCCTYPRFLERKATLSSYHSDLCPEIVAHANRCV